jgi:hypothetical protein
MLLEWVMLFLVNDLIVELNPESMVHPLDGERFSNLSLDYIAHLGKEMFAADPMAHRHSPERAKRLAYLIHLKAPRTNAVSFSLNPSGGLDGVDVEYKSLNEMMLGVLYQQQVTGELDTQKIEMAVWNKAA